MSMWSIFRWCKFTQITIGHLNWPFGIFGQIWAQGTLRDILGPILVIFEMCHFLTVPGPFEYFSENGALRKLKFSQ